MYIHVHVNVYTVLFLWEGGVGGEREERKNREGQRVGRGERSEIDCGQRGITHML